MRAKHTYRSPLRAEQAAATRDRILGALESILKSGADLDAASYKAIATRAGVREITVYRHFPNKVELLRAFWAWLNERRGNPTLARDESGLLAQVRSEFAAADEIAPLIVASLTSKEGREMQKSWNAERRATLDEALGGMIGPVSGVERTRVLAILHLLMSAHAWHAMRDLWDLDGREAGEAVAWALATLFRDLQSGRRPRRKVRPAPASRPRRRAP